MCCFGVGGVSDIMDYVVGGIMWYGLLVWGEIFEFVFGRENRDY